MQGSLPLISGFSTTILRVEENRCPQPLELGIVEVLSLALGLGNAESERAQSVVAAPDLRKLSASQKYSNLSPFSLLHCVGLLRRYPRAILPITQGRDAGPEAHRPKSVVMRLPVDAVISPTKIANYLLAWRLENDKSQFLSQAGYDAADPDRLGDDIRSQLLPLEAEFEEKTEYGEKFQIGGSLTGPNGKILRVVSIWMTESATGTTKFITLYPAKEN